MPRIGPIGIDQQAFFTVCHFYGIEDGIVCRVGLPFEPIERLYKDVPGRVHTGFSPVLQPGLAKVQVLSKPLLLQIFNSL